MPEEKSIQGALNTIAAKVGAAGGNGGGLEYLAADLSKKLAVYQNAVSRQMGHTEADEQVLLTYTTGDVQIVIDNGRPIGLINNYLYNLDGLLIGRYETIWTPVPGAKYFDVPATAFTAPMDFNKPATTELPGFEPRAQTISTFQFNGHGTPKGKIFTAGPLNVLLTHAADGGLVFHVSAGTYITGGTEEFDGARGVNAALGSSYFSPEQTAVILADPDNPTFPINTVFQSATIQTFRVVLRKKQPKK